MIITWFWLSTASAHFACLLTWHTTLSYRSLCNQIYSHGKTFTEPNQTWTPFNFPTSKRSAGTGSNFWIAWFFSPSFVCSKASKPGRLFWLSWRWLQNCRKKEKKKQKVRKQKFGERIHQTAHQMVIQTLERQGLSYPKVSKMFTKKNSIPLLIFCRKFNERAAEMTENFRQQPTPREGKCVSGAGCMLDWWITCVWQSLYFRPVPSIGSLSCPQHRHLDSKISVALGKLHLALLVETNSSWMSVNAPRIWLCFFLSILLT